MVVSPRGSIVASLEMYQGGASATQAGWLDQQELG
jgi:hypothetical protein